MYEEIAQNDSDTNSRLHLFIAQVFFKKLAKQMAVCFKRYVDSFLLRLECKKAFLNLTIILKISWTESQKSNFKKTK